MEEVLTPIAFHGILSVRESQFEVPKNEQNARERDLRCTPLLACIAKADIRCQVGDNFLLRHNILVSRHQSFAYVFRDYEITPLTTYAEMRQRRSLTVLDLTRQYYLEFLADIGIKQAVEIKPVRSFLPTGQV